ncbi:type II toxin-antitoxin system PemK/MazF family toxin [Bacillus sp. JJ722]|uniref:type II toxin-antitoxin system PemK/MazF family toxin n=1 Tax=Bacillus sp. JJ722 TaxID=3122973 RepID=UPI002FFDA01D
MKIGKYKGKLKVLKGKVPIPKMKEDVESILDSKALMDELFNYLMSTKQDYGIMWLMGAKRYLDDKKERLKSPFSGHLDRGHLVEVELFRHFNKELTFIHPAVILYESLLNWVIIAPISTGKYCTGDDFHIDVDENDGLRHQSAICLNDIRAIDKNRILYQHSKEGQNVKVQSITLDKIDQVLIEKIMPVTYKRYCELEIALEQEKRNHSKTILELEVLKSKLVVN